MSDAENMEKRVGSPGARGKKQSGFQLQCTRVEKLKWCGDVYFGHVWPHRNAQFTGGFYGFVDQADDFLSGYASPEMLRLGHRRKAFSVKGPIADSINLLGVENNCIVSRVGFI